MRYNKLIFNNTVPLGESKMARYSVGHSIAFLQYFNKNRGKNGGTVFGGGGGGGIFLQYFNKNRGKNGGTVFGGGGGRYFFTVFE